MPQLATFTLKSIDLAKKPGPRNIYTDGQPEKQWRVVMDSGLYPDRRMTLWFNEEYQARKIPLGAPTVQEIMGIYLAGQQSLKCQQMVETPSWMEKNIYTGRSERKPSWSVDFVPMVESDAIQGMSLAYPTPYEGTIWSPDVSYNLPQFVLKMNPAHATGTFTCAITLANAVFDPNGAANVIGILTTLSFSGNVTPPQLSWNAATATVTLSATLNFSDVLTAERLYLGAALSRGTSSMTLLQGSGDENLWALTMPYGPSDMMYAMQPNIVTYPASNYPTEFDPNFFDKFGFHPPGTAPLGNYPGGFVWENAAFKFVGLPAQGTDAKLQQVSNDGVLAKIIDGNLNGIITAGYNAGQTYFQAF